MSPSGGAPTLEDQPASSTGIMAFGVASGTPRLFLPSSYGLTDGRIQVSVVGPSVPSGAVGLIRHVDLGGTASARAVGGAGRHVVVADRDAPGLDFIDAASETLLGAADSPAEAERMITSNNPGSSSSTVAVDGTAGKAYVAVSYGVLEYDVATCDRYPPGDPEMPAVTDRVDVIDIATHRRWTVTNPDVGEPRAPLGFDPDDVAIDTGLRLLALANEEGPTLQLVDLAACTYDDDTQTCRAPNVTIPMPDTHDTQLAIDPATHLLVVGREDGSGVAFIDLEKAKKGIVSMLPVVLPTTPDGQGWANVGDSHGPVIGLVGGRAYAFLPRSGCEWTARVDLAGVKQVLAGQGRFADQVQFISVPPPP